MVTLTRDDRLWCDDIFIQIENTVFKVPQRLFEDSPIFRDMFSLPQATESVPDGFDEANPLRLDGIRARDFRALLDYLFPRYAQPDLVTNARAECRDGRPSSRESRATEEWTAVLALATMWELASARTAAIDALDALVVDPARRAALARSHSIAGWACPALLKLVRRAAPLSRADADALGVEWVLKLAALREACGPGRKVPGCSDRALAKRLAREFDLEDGDDSVADYNMPPAAACEPDDSPPAAFRFLNLFE